MTIDPRIRPSNLPALKECPCFEPGPSDFAEAGTDRHQALRAHFDGNDGLLDLLPAEDAEGVLWAAEYIRTRAPLSDHPLRFEHPLTLILDDFSEISGTPDVTCHLDLFDLKWRRRDYTAQLACYVLMRLQELGISATIHVHILYGAFQQAEVLNLNAESARAIVQPIIERARDPNRQPSPCSYCSWCANQLTCAASNLRAQTVAAGRDDWQLQTYHASNILDPREMSKALTLAKHLAKWCKAVEHHALEMALKRGEQIPGYKLKSRAGKRSCHDLAGAHQMSGLPVDTFLACCDLRFTTSKDNPSKKGLEDVYAETHGLKKSAAKRELARKLQPFLRTPKDNPYLAADTQTEEEEETTHA